MIKKALLLAANITVMAATGASEATCWLDFTAERSSTSTGNDRCEHRTEHVGPFNAEFTTTSAAGSQLHALGDGASMTILTGTLSAGARLPYRGGNGSTKSLSSNNWTTETELPQVPSTSANTDRLDVVTSVSFAAYSSTHAGTCQLQSSIQHQRGGLRDVLRLYILRRRGRLGRLQLQHATVWYHRLPV